MAALKWIGLEPSDVRTPEVLGADPEDVKTWIVALAYCSEQMNGGRIVGCKKWKPAAWLPVVGVSPEAVDHDCDLFHWEGDDLLVEHYDHGGEARARASQEYGKRGAAKRWGEGNEPEDSDSPPTGPPSSPPYADGQTDGLKGRTEGRTGRSPSAAPLGGGGRDVSPSNGNSKPIREFRAISGGDVVTDTFYEADMESALEECSGVDVMRIAMEYLDAVDAGRIERPPSGCFDGVLVKLCRAEMAEAT